MSRGSLVAARLAAWLACLCLAPLLVLGISGSAEAAGGDNPPDWCFRANQFGDLPTCTWDGASWHRSYDGGGGLGGGGGDGVGGAFGVLFVLVLAGGIGLTVWKVSTARRMARGSGMSVGDATAMTLLTDDGFEATYLASNLRGARPSDAPVQAAAGGVARPAAERLRELAELREQGVITVEEHDRRRAAILDSL